MLGLRLPGVCVHISSCKVGLALQKGEDAVSSCGLSLYYTGPNPTTRDAPAWGPRVH